MKRYGCPSLLLLTLAACQAASHEPEPESQTESSRPSPTTDLRELATRMRFDLADLQKGESCLFTIKAGDKAQIYKVSVVQKEESTLWIEEKFPPEDRNQGQSLIKKYEMDVDGTI